MSPSAIISDGPTAWKLLNGLFCLYKPTEVSVNAIRSALITNICRSLNELPARPVGQYVSIQDDMDVIIREDYADHPLVVGPRYQSDDVRITCATVLGRRTSGVLVMGINKGTKKSMAFHQSRPLRTFRIKGLLGQVTDNMFIDGKILQKASFEHVKRQHLDKVLATFQANHQRQMFHQSGVDLHSQTAYELASKGSIRPTTKNDPWIYNLKTIDFKPPNFAIEVQSINEYEDFLLKLIFDIGQRLRTVATCTGLQCIHYGCFTTEHALLRRYWTTQHIISSIAQCDRIMTQSNFNLNHEPFLIESKLR